MSLEGKQWLLDAEKRRAEVDPTKILSLRTDPESQRMVGWTNHGNKRIDVPWISMVDDSRHLPITSDVTVEDVVADADGELDGELLYHPLYQGGCQQGLVLPEKIDHLLSLYMWEQYEYSRELMSEKTVEMYDSLDQAFDQIEELAHEVNELRKTGTVLVHCQAGLNRSGLVAARSLMLLGATADEAITQLRTTRSEACLCNPSFEAWLRAL